MSESIWGDSETQFFYDLTPETILEAVDGLGFKTSGRVLTLNSMENRVYEVEVDEGFIIAKFYRPGRWSKEQILDEHQFLLDLIREEVPVIAPLIIEGRTLFLDSKTELNFALFPKKGGRAPDEMKGEELDILGRQLARLHSVGKEKRADQRLEITPEVFGRQNLNYLLNNQLIPFHLEESYRKIVEDLLSLSLPFFKGVSYHRIHGDCHLGNIIFRPDEGFFFIDFDDMLMGPAVQDIWLITPGRDEQGIRDRDRLLSAYTTMADFDFNSLKLIEPLRALRYIHFTTWIAKRWKDPSFQNAFPFFGDESYWQGQLQNLREQRGLIENIR